MSKTLEERVADLEAFVVTLKAAIAGRASEPTVASEAELDGPYGDPSVRKDPPRWHGESFAGRTMSRCPPDYLDALAGFFEWRAGKEAADGKEKYAGYSRRDAARARGWSARIRDGWRPTPEPERDESSSFGGSSWGRDSVDDPYADRGDDGFHSPAMDDDEAPL